MNRSVYIISLTVMVAAMLVSSWPTAEQLYYDLPADATCADCKDSQPFCQYVNDSSACNDSSFAAICTETCCNFGVISPDTCVTPVQETCQNNCSDQATWCTYITTPDACNNTYMEGQCAQTCCKLGVIQPQDCKVPPDTKTCKTQCTDKGSWCNYISTPDACNNTYMEGECAMTCCVLGVVLPANCKSN